jgi:hypothetical protein
MNWFLKIVVSFILLVLLTSLHLHAKTGRSKHPADSRQEELLTTSPSLINPAELIWINAPLPEKSDELLFIEESEEDVHNWILLKSNRIFYTCISILFGQPDQGMELQALTFIAAPPQPLHSTIDRLSQLQLFRI